MKKHTKIHQLMNEKNMDEIEKIIGEINAGETFWDDIDKYELAELMMCAWDLNAEWNISYPFDISLYNSISQTLEDAYNCYEKRFVDDNDMRALMGFFIGLRQDLFSPKIAGFEIDISKGDKMIALAHENDKENMFIKWLNTHTDANLMHSLAEPAKKDMNRMFEPCPAIREYFNHIIRSE